MNICTQPESSPRPVPGSGRAWWRGPASDEARHDDNRYYAVIDYWNIRRMIRVLNAGSDDVFVPDRLLKP